MTYTPEFSYGPNVGFEIILPAGLAKIHSKVTKKLPGLIRRITIAGKNFWKSEAGRRLKSSRKAYQDAIDFDITGKLEAVLVLADRFAVDIEFGSNSFDMKPGFMKGAKPLGKRKFPKDIRHLLRTKSPIQMYRIIPLNVNRRISMTKPTVFRTIHDQSTGWKHPGLKAANIIPVVMDELNKNIIPKMLDEFMKENL